MIKPVMSMFATTEDYHKADAEHYKDKYILMTQQYTRDIDKFHLALKDYHNSHAGKPKSCGHEFFCVCPSDNAKKLLELFDD